MGGSGSGRWGWHTKKTVVEDCLAFSINEVVGRVLPRQVFDKRMNWAGSIIWRRVHSGEVASSVGYQLLFDNDPRLVLDYKATSWNGSQSLWNYPVRLLTTPCHYGGVRWWFECSGCRRRVGKLYIPPQGGRFACRHCYDLSYTSAQEAHKYDRGGLGGLGHSIAVLDKLYRIEERLEKCKRWSKRKERLLFRYLQLSDQLTATMPVLDESGMPSGEDLDALLAEISDGDKALEKLLAEFTDES
jgi:hypothetical protein